MHAGELIQERYRLDAPLGTGGMAEVWSATDERLERSVAVKFLAPQLSADPEFLVRFFSEAQAVARISHRNVTQVMDFGEHAGSPYLVMELVRGGPLTTLVGEPFPVEEAFALIARAARGAGAAHALGIVHRDIKPANVLLDQDGVPKLADFGIAASARSERLTATGAAIGSPHYISPEQASGGDATPASDVYSLGILLYELLTGKKPFEGNNITAIAIAQVEQEPVPPSAHVAAIGPDIDAVVLRCLAKDPEARFADGNELASELEDPQDAAAVAPPIDEEEFVPTSAWWARRGVLVGSVLVIMLAAVGAMVLAGGNEPAALAEEELDDIEGLEVGRRKSPRVSAISSAGRRPTPTPIADEKKRETKVAGERERKDEPAPRRSEDPEPTPEPSESEPNPEPTTESSPAP